MDLLETLGLRRRELEQELVLSDQAKELLQHPLVTRFFAETEAKLIAAWRGTAESDREARERAFRLLAVLDEMKAYFEKWLGDPEYAVRELEELLKHER